MENDGGRMYEMLKDFTIILFFFSHKFKLLNVDYHTLSTMTRLWKRNCGRYIHIVQLFFYSEQVEPNSFFFLSFLLSKTQPPLQWLGTLGRWLKDVKNNVESHTQSIAIL